MRLTRKYEFDNEAQVDALIAALPHDEEGNPTYKHAILKLGNLVDTPATYDDEGNELTAAVLKTKYAVDVYWEAEPLEAWNQYIVWPTPLGRHSFGSSSSRDEYAKTYCELFPDSLYCNPPEPTEEELL